MSLVMAIANKNGIVVSGDWRAMKYWLQPDGGDPIFVRSIDRFQKNISHEIQPLYRLLWTHKT